MSNIQYALGILMTCRTTTQVMDRKFVTHLRAHWVLVGSKISRTRGLLDRSTHVVKTARSTHALSASARGQPRSWSAGEMLRTAELAVSSETPSLALGLRTRRGHRLAPRPSLSVEIFGRDHNPSSCHHASFPKAATYSELVRCQAGSRQLSSRRARGLQMSKFPPHAPRPQHVVEINPERDREGANCACCRPRVVLNDMSSSQRSNLTPP